MKKIKILLTCIVIGLFIIAAGGSDSDSSSESSSSASVGDQVTVSEDCFGAISEDAFDELTKAAVAKDEVGVMNMMMQGTVRKISSGTTGKLLDLGFTKKQVRLNDDQQAWYIASEFVK